MTIKSSHIFLQGRPLLLRRRRSRPLLFPAGSSADSFTARWEASWAGLKNTMTQTALEIL